MAVNLATNYSDKIAEAFAHASFLAGKTSTRYDFTGTKGLKIYTPTTVPLTNYNRAASSNRYGTPTEMQDTVQEVVLSQDKSFSLVIDKGNNMDQLNTKEAGRMLRMEIDEQVAPTVDAHAIAEWVKNAGIIKAESAAMTKSNIIEYIGAGMAAMDNKLVPSDNRYIGISPANYNLIRLSPEFVGLETIGTRGIEKGVVGELFGAKVVKLPSALLPASNFNFIIWYKGSVLEPQKIADSKIHKDPPGISGSLLEGRWYYDAFVLGAKAGGVYVSVASGSQQTAPTVAHSSNSLTITSSGADLIKYVTDGSDPRYSDSAKTYSAAVSTSGWASGTYVVNAVAYDASNFTSNLGTLTITI